MFTFLQARKMALYNIGVTNNLYRRMYKHKNKTIGGFTKKYNIDKLVHFETTNDIRIAIHREKRVKKWYRKWKVELIEEDNPEWRDLSEDWF